MARVSTVLILALGLVSLVNLRVASARAFDEDEDEDSFWSSEEKEPPAEKKGLEMSHDHHQSHDSAHLQPPPVNPSRLDSPEPFQGSNIAGFNESCGGSRICNSKTQLVCSPLGVCECAPAHVYIRSEESCLRIALADGVCEFNDQCHAGNWGKHSRCSRTEARCECYDVQQNGKRPTIFHNERCFIKTSLNDPCESDSDCQSSMYGGSYCAPRDPNALPSWVNATQVCQCKTGYVWYNPLNACLKIAAEDLASKCQVDLQCHVSPLGDLSKCGLESTKCECHDPAKPGKENVVFYKPRKTCFQRKDWNDTCTEHDECKASISSNAECLLNTAEGSDFKNQMTCQCPEGKTCPRDTGDGAVGLGSSTTNFIVLATAVLVLGDRFNIM